MCGRLSSHRLFSWNVFRATLVAMRLADRLVVDPPLHVDAEPPTFAKEPVPLKVIVRQAVEEAERRAILDALATTSWNRRRAARLLKVSYRSLLYKIRDYAIVPVGALTMAESDLVAQAGPPLRSPLSSREGSC